MERRRYVAAGAGYAAARRDAANSIRGQLGDFEARRARLGVTEIELCCRHCRRPVMRRRVREGGKLEDEAEGSWD